MHAQLIRAEAQQQAQQQVQQQVQQQGERTQEGARGRKPCAPTVYDSRLSFLSSSKDLSMSERGGSSGANSS